MQLQEPPPRNPGGLCLAGVLRTPQGSRMGVHSWSTGSKDRRNGLPEWPGRRSQLRTAHRLLTWPRSPSLGLPRREGAWPQMALSDVPLARVACYLGRGQNTHAVFVGRLAREECWEADSRSSSEGQRLLSSGTERKHWPWQVAAKVQRNRSKGRRRCRAPWLGWPRRTEACGPGLLPRTPR